MFRNAVGSAAYTLLAFALAFASFVGVTRAAEDVNAIYAKGFGGEESAVREAHNRKKTAAFAGELLESAKLVKEDPAYQALLFNKAFEIGMLFPDGAAVAAEAMDQWGKIQPRSKDAADVNLLSAMEKQFQSMRGYQHTVAVAAYVDRALEIADGLAAGQKYDDAITICTKAKSVLSMAAARHNDVQDRLLVFKEEQVAAKRIAELKATLKVTALDLKAATELVRLLVLVEDRPDQAGEYVNATGDAKLKKIIPLATQDIAALSEQDALELGDWYRAQTTKSGKLTNSVAWKRAKSAYERFLALHARKDADFLNASRALTDANEALPKLPGADIGKRTIARADDGTHGPVPTEIADASHPRKVKTAGNPPAPGTLSAPPSIVPQPASPALLSPAVVANLQNLGASVDIVFHGYTRVPKVQFNRPIPANEWPKLLNQLSPVFAVRFNTDSDTDEVWAQIAKLPNFTALISGGGITDAGIASFARHPKLEDIDVAGSHVTGACLPDLATIPNLRSLNIGFTHGIHGPILKPLLQSRKLVMLVLEADNFIDEDIAELAGQPSLEIFNLGGTHITGECAAALVEMKSLRSLNLDGTHFSDEGIIKLSRHASLEYLRLVQCSVGPAGIAALPNFKHLQSLVLGRAAKGFSDAEMRSVAKCARLETLGIIDSDFSDNQIEYLNELPRLRALNVSNTKVGAAGIMRLSGKIIERLELRGTAVSGQELITIAAHFPNLKGFVAGRTATVTPEIIQDLKRKYPTLDIQIEGK